MKRIGMLTSGGDCQALNAAMRGVVKSISNAEKPISSTPSQMVTDLRFLQFLPRINLYN